MAGVPVVAALTTTSAPVHINVGGSPYISTLETLTKFPETKLAKLFNGTVPITVDPITNSFFIDRDGKIFRHILNYLRNSKLVLPDHFKDVQLLLEEAAYFELEDLTKELTDGLTQVTNDSESEKISDEETCDQQAGKKPRKRKGKRPTDNPSNASKNCVPTTETEVSESEESSEEEQQTGKKQRRRKEKRSNGANDASENLVERLNTQVEVMTGFMDTVESQLGKLTDVMTASVKSTAVEAKTLESSASTGDQSNQQLSDVVFVMTLSNGEVQEVWSSDGELSEQLPGAKTADLTCYRTQLRPSYCREPVLDLSYASMWLPCLAKLLRNKHYLLVSSLATVDTFGKPRLLHCFLR